MPRDRPNAAEDNLQNMEQRYIFNGTDIHNETASRETALRKEIQELDSNYLLNVSEEDLVRWLVEKFRMDVPVILDQELHVADHKETQIDVSKDPRRIKPRGYRGHPFYVTGTKIIIAVPFEGNPEFLTIRPSKLTSPIPDASIVDSEIHLEYKQVEADADALQRMYAATITRIKGHLEMLKGAANGFNTSLEPLIRRLVSERKKKLLDTAGMVASLGLPIKRREGAPNTYSVPLKRKRARIERPKATSEAFQPEPALAIEEWLNLHKGT